MANSITLKSNSYDGRYLQLVCEQTSKNSANNTSTVKWTLSAVGGNENYYTTGPTKVIINGTTVYSKSRVAWDDKTFPAAKGSTSGTLTITHTNDGSKSISVSLSTAIYTSTTNEQKGTWTLDNIARYFTEAPTLTLSSRTETTATFKWTTPENCSWVRYHLDGSDNSTNVFNGGYNGGDYSPAKSGTFTVSGLGVNTSHTIYVECARADSKLWSNSNTPSFTTYDYPYCTESPNFVLGEAVTLKFYNPLKHTFKFYIIGNGVQINEDYDCSSDTYTGVTSTTTSVPYLYATIPNAKSGKYKVKVVYGSSTKTRDNGNTYTIKESECYPTFTTGYTLKDTGSKTASITNGEFLIKGYSSLSVEIPVSAQMKAKNGANAKNYTASFNGINETIDYSSTATTNCSFGVVNTTGEKEINVRAYDTRGLSTLAKKSITIYDYYVPKIYIDVKRENNFGENATLKVSGQYNTLTVNNVAKNTITKCEYRYREKGSDTWGDWVTLTTTLNNGKFTCNDVTFTRLNNNLSFEFEARVTDKLNTIATSDVLNAGQGVFFISSNKKNCFINGLEVSTRQDYVVNGEAVETNVYERGHIMYKQCFNGHLSSESNVTTIQLPENAVLRNMYGNIYYTNSKLFIPLNYANPSAAVFTYYNVETRQIVINLTTTTFRGCEFVVYAEYTIG